MSSIMFSYCIINVNRGGLYIDSPDWIKNKKATIHPINEKIIINVFNTLQQLH